MNLPALVKYLEARGLLIPAAVLAARLAEK
jgi:hypothetical protein